MADWPWSDCTYCTCCSTMQPFALSAKRSDMLGWLRRRRKLLNGLKQRHAYLHYLNATVAPGLPCLAPCSTSHQAAASSCDWVGFSSYRRLGCVSLISAGFIFPSRRCQANVAKVALARLPPLSTDAVLPLHAGQMGSPTGGERGQIKRLPTLYGKYGTNLVN